MQPICVEAARLADKVDHLPSTQPLVEEGILRQTADSRPHTQTVTGRVQTIHQNPSRRGLQQRRTHLDRRRLAGTIGPEEDEQLAILDLQVKTIHGYLVAVVLGDRFELDHAVESLRCAKSSVDRYRSPELGRMTTI